MKTLLRVILTWVSVGLVAADKSEKPPNIVIIFTDDQAYGDVGVYGSPNLDTPRLDRMAAEGLRFTDFYVTTSVCSASRASLLTGRYPDLNGTPGVYFPGARGLDTAETTMAEMLRESGFATALIGKWHLGDLPGSLPTHHGFDQYWGVPYSNDMYIGPTMTFASDVVLLEDYDLAQAKADREFVGNHIQDRAAIRERSIRDLVPLLRNEEIIEYPADQATLTRRTFNEAITFIDQATKHQQPFFLFITPSMPHIPLFASADFEGKSRGGLFGDTIEEIDFNVGRLLDHLDETGLDEETLVVFTTDNGPWLGMGDHAGTAGPFRDGKFSTYEGGIRVPAIMRWPGKIPAGAVSHDPASTIDLLPTAAQLTGTKPPAVELDGIDLSPLLRDPSVSLDREPLFFYRNGKPVAVRQGYWKYFPNGGGRRSTESDAPELYYLATDLSESRNLATKEPDRVRQMQTLIAAQRARLTP
ncbi:MAG: sulfatase [Synoicihabitans sp.]